MFSTEIHYEVVVFSIGDTKAGTKMGKLQLKDPETGELLNCILWEEALNRMDSKLFRTLRDEGILIDDHEGGCVLFEHEEEVKKMQQKLSHGGFVFRTGNTTKENGHVLELSLKLDSNPEFTGSVLTAYGRAIARLAKEGKTGCVTVFDIPIKYLSPMSEQELRAHLL